MGGVGNGNSVRHGATSSRHFAPLARNHRRRVLRQLGLSLRDLSPLARGYLDLYCRTAAKIDLLDAYYAEHGLLQEGGMPQPSVAFYTSLVNSSRLALGRLEDAVKALRRSPGDELAAYLRGLEDDAAA